MCLSAPLLDGGRAQALLRNIAVVLMSLHLLEKRCMAEGCAACLSWPFAARGLYGQLWRENGPVAQVVRAHA